MTTIYSYFDYREYLRENFAERKRKNPKYSYRAIANTMGINSATLVRIINGKRNISKTLLPIFIDYLKLKSKEAKYFSTLVIFNQTGDSSQRRHYYTKIVQFRNEQKMSVKPDKYELYEEWYYSAVRELLSMYAFDGDYETVAGMIQPAITARESKKAIKVLDKLGFIKRNKTGQYNVIDDFITTSEKWRSTAIHRFQIAVLKKALEAMDCIPKEERDISTLTVCFSNDGFERVREVLKRTRDEISAIETADLKKNRVYQINFQLFPLSTKVKESNHEN